MTAASCSSRVTWENCATWESSATWESCATWESHIKTGRAGASSMLLIQTQGLVQAFEAILAQPRPSGLTPMDQGRLT
ncbi:hypothetical protein HGM15179_011943 [Zosterops borbonicus]|uniref:Uncharacterized protein n=1 Tax=Zosterops borbonicus TaxID=364589 RepID=A0A8K1GBN5_9PASS|nr:hypothetical protein HGM15179_011943 [Zosterops borbonicus]